MTNKIKIADFEDLALALKPSLDTHGVPKELHYSIISDALFSFASFLDEKSGTNFHEDIFAVLDNYVEKLGESAIGDFLVAEIDIVFEKGRKAEVNLLKSHLDNNESLQFALEIELELRDLDEIDEEIDADSRFIKLIKKKKGIKLLKFNSAEDLENENWFDVSLKGSEFGRFEQSLSGLKKCIREVANQWL